VSGVLSGGNQEATPTVPAVAEVEETDTPEPTDDATPRPTATNPPNAAATELAQIVADLTAEAVPTETDTPTRTPTRTPSPTPTTNATAAFLDNCEPGVDLVSVVRSGFATNAVTIGFGFPARWELRNSGTCPWSEDFTWQYVEGEEFEYEDGPIPLGDMVPAGESIELTADFTAPNAAGTYESVWQLFDGDTAFGDPITFEFRAFPLPTNTPQATNTPAATATSDSPTASGTVDWIYTVGTCDYPGGSDDWRCAVTITPYIDGSDAVGQFTIFIFDLPSGQAAEYRGTGPFTHFVRARRCATYNHEVRIIDDVTGTEISEQLFIDPDNHFPSGCTLP